MLAIELGIDRAVVLCDRLSQIADWDIQLACELVDGTSLDEGGMTIEAGALGGCVFECQWRGILQDALIENDVHRRARL